MDYALKDFFEFSPSQRSEILLEEIKGSHTFHFGKNSAYRRAIRARGVSEDLTYEGLVHVLRPTAQVFKSYIDILGTPFPNHEPKGFIEWMDDHLSINLPKDRLTQIKSQYPSLEDLLCEIESIYSDLGIEIGTSSGTSGRATIIVHDNNSATKAAEAYQLAVYRLWGTVDEHTFLFVMPRETRIVMARIARMATARLGFDAQAHFTIPFSASPDQVRVRTGRLFETGMRGWTEQRILHPFMNWMNENYVKSKYVNRTIALLEEMVEAKEDVLLFGGWVQLHHIYEGLLDRGYGLDGRRIILGLGSLIGTGGGMKESYPFAPHQISHDLQTVIRTEGGAPIPHRDVYGMAEANWAAAQCEEGNYHLPPWLYAVVVDENDEIVERVEAVGLLAFFDPLTDGGLYPNFFKTTDRVHLVNGGRSFQHDRVCPCGYQTTYIVKESIIRQDRLDEAGCAGQI
jgi:hypothetical protein